MAYWTTYDESLSGMPLAHNLVTLAGIPDDDSQDRPDRVVSFKLSNDQSHVNVWEECDGYFGAKLSPAQVDRLIASLTAMRAQMT